MKLVILSCGEVLTCLFGVGRGDLPALFPLHRQLREALSYRRSTYCKMDVQSEELPSRLFGPLSRQFGKLYIPVVDLVRIANHHLAVYIH